MRSLLKRSNKDIIKHELSKSFINRLHNAIFDYPDYFEDDFEYSFNKDDEYGGTIKISLSSTEGIVSVTIFSDSTVYLHDEESKPLNIANQIALINLMFDYGYLELNHKL